MDTWRQVTDFIHHTTGLERQRFEDILWTALVVLLYFVFRSILRKLIAHYWQDASRRYVAMKSVSTILGIVAILFIVRIWLGGMAGFMTYLGLLSAGVAVALKDPLANMAGWLFILVRGPFHVGDRIQLGQTAGDVVDIRLFQFSVIEIGNWVDADQSTGRIIHVPNGLLFQHPVANYTQGFAFIWNEIQVTVTFESDWKKAKGLLREIADRNSAYDMKRAEQEVRQAADKYLIHYRYLTPIVWTAVADSGVNLTIRYLCNPRARRSTETKMWEDVLERFAACDDIDFAYPTERFYFNRSEGKSGAGGGPVRSMHPAFKETASRGTSPLFFAFFPQRRRFENLIHNIFVHGQPHQRPPELRTVEAQIAIAQPAESYRTHRMQQTVGHRRADTLAGPLFLAVLAGDERGTRDDVRQAGRGEFRFHLDPRPVVLALGPGIRADRRQIHKKRRDVGGLGCLQQ